jgi:hypothetical protein
MAGSFGESSAPWPELHLFKRYLRHVGPDRNATVRRWCAEQGERATTYLVCCMMWALAAIVPWLVAVVLGVAAPQHKRAVHDLGICFVVLFAICFVRFLQAGALARTYAKRAD